MKALLLFFFVFFLPASVFAAAAIKAQDGHDDDAELILEYQKPDTAFNRFRMHLRPRDPHLDDIILMEIHENLILVQTTVAGMSLNYNLYALRRADGSNTYSVDPSPNLDGYIVEAKELRILLVRRSRYDDDLWQLKSRLHQLEFQAGQVEFNADKFFKRKDIDRKWVPVQERLVRGSADTLRRAAHTATYFAYVVGMALVVGPVLMTKGGVHWSQVSTAVVVAGGIGAIQAANLIEGPSLRNRLRKAPFELQPGWKRYAVGATFNIGLGALATGCGMFVGYFTK